MSSSQPKSRQSSNLSPPEAATSARTLSPGSKQRGSSLLTPPRSTTPSAAAPRSDDEFDFVDENEAAVSAIGSNTQCNRCTLPFSLLRRRHRCRFCNKHFCDNCCKKHPEDGFTERICHDCHDMKLRERSEARRLEIEAQAQRIRDDERQKQFHASALSLDDVEAGDRSGISRDEAVEFEPFARLERRERKAAIKATEAREKSDAEAAKVATRDHVLDKWAAERGARCGALSLTVVRATNVQPVSLRPHVSPYAVVRFGDHEFRSPTFKHEGNPEFDFNVYVLVENDTLPITITVMDDFVTPVFVGNLALNLRRPYPNLVKDVSADGVLTEKGNVLQSIFNEKGERLPDTTVSIRWSLEVRETNTHVFCPDCGRVDSRCRCTPEERERRYAAEATQRMEVEKAIYVEQTKRLLAQQQQQEAAEAAKARAEAEAAKKEAQRLALEEENQQKRKMVIENRNKASTTTASATTTVPAGSGSATTANEPVGSSSTEPKKVHGDDEPPKKMTDAEARNEQPADYHHKEGDPVKVHGDIAPEGKEKPGGCCLVQ